MIKNLQLISALVALAFSSYGQISLNSTTTQYFTFDNTTVLEAPLDVINNNNYPVDINIIRTVEVLDPNHEEYFCFGLYCYLPDTDTSLYATTVPANSTETSFKAYADPKGFDGYDRLHYRFYDVNNPSDSAVVTLEFYFNVAGVNEITESSYLKFKNEVNNFTVLNYKLPANVKQARIDVHNMLGSKMRSVPLSEKQGMKILTTSDFANGVYLVSLVVNNKVSQSQRMVVNHASGN